MDDAVQQLLTGPLLRAAGEMVDIYMVANESPPPKSKAREPDPVGVRKRTREQREADLLLIDRMANKQMISISEVTEHLNSIRPYQLSRSQVQQDNREVILLFRETMGKSLIDMKLREVASLEHLEREALEAWERSKEDKHGVTQVSEAAQAGRSGQSSAMNVVRKVNTKEKSNGDPRFLQVLLSLKERKHKLCGLDAPLKLELEATGASTMLSFPQLKEAFRKKVLREHFAAAPVEAR